MGNTILPEESSSARRDVSGGQYPVFEPVNLLAESGDAVVMGDDDETVAVFLVKMEQQVDDLVAGGGIEIARGFVGEEKRGIVPQGACDGHPLLFASGEFRRAVVESRAEADLFQEMRALGGIAVPGETRGKFDIFERGKFREKMVGLKNETDRLIAPSRELAARPGVDRFALPTDFAGVGALEAAENLQQRAFA